MENNFLTLQGKWWHQLILCLVGLAAIFLTNAIITVLSSIILNEEYEIGVISKEGLAKLYGCA